MCALSASVRIWFLANCMICSTRGSFSIPMARAASEKVSSLAYWVAKLRIISTGIGGRSAGESALISFSNSSRVMLLTHPGGGAVAPAAGWQAPFRVITGSFIGTTLVLGRVAGGGGGCIGVAAGAWL